MKGLKFVAIGLAACLIFAGCGEDSKEETKQTEMRTVYRDGNTTFREYVGTESDGEEVIVKWEKVIDKDGEKKSEILFEDDDWF
jgi:hypothetical protein